MVETDHLPQYLVAALVVVLVGLKLEELELLVKETLVVMRMHPLLMVEAVEDLGQLDKMLQLEQVVMVAQVQHLQ